MALVTPTKDETSVLGAGPEFSPTAPSGLTRGVLWRSVRFLAAFAGFAADVMWQMTRSSILRALKRRPRITRVERDSPPVRPSPNHPERLVSRREPEIRIEGRASNRG